MTDEEIHNIWLHMSGKAEGLLEAGGTADLPVLFANAILEYNKRTWQGLTQDEFKQIMLDTYNIDLNVPGHSSDDHLLWRAIEAKLRSKNACEENATDPSKEDWDSACNNLAEARTIPNPEFDKTHTQHKPNTA